MTDKYPYKVYRGGVLILAATESCRYPKKVELDLLENGYTIKLHGKRITRKEIKNGGEA